MFCVSISFLFLAGCVQQPQQIVESVPVQTPVVSAQPSPKSLVERIASPNGEYEALVIDSEKTLIYADQQVNFIPVSNNIWLFEKETQRYVQVTEHQDYVIRENIYWTKDDRLIFTEGDSTVTEYNPMTKKKNVLLGPVSPTGVCVDACGFAVTFITSPQKRYYIKLFDGLGNNTAAIEWVNIETGVTGKVEGQYALSIDELTFDAENQFTIPGRTLQDSGMYGAPDYGPLEELVVRMR